MRKSKNRYFYHFFVSPGDAPEAITLNVVWMEIECLIRCLQIVSQHVPIYLQQFPSYSNRKCKKSPFLTYRSPHFCFPWRRLCYYHATCCMDGKTIQCLANASQHVPTVSIFNSFRVIRCLSQWVSPKIAIFTTFWFPLGTPRGQSR